MKEKTVCGLEIFYIPLLIQNRLLNPQDRIVSLSDFEVTLGRGEASVSH